MALPQARVYGEGDPEAVVVLGLPFPACSVRYMVPRAAASKPSCISWTEDSETVTTAPCRPTGSLRFSCCLCPLRYTRLGSASGVFLSCPDPWLHRPLACGHWPPAPFGRATGLGRERRELGSWEPWVRNFTVNMLAFSKHLALPPAAQGSPVWLQPWPGQEALSKGHRQVALGHSDMPPRQFSPSSYKEARVPHPMSQVPSQAGRGAPVTPEEGQTEPWVGETR